MPKPMWASHTAGNVPFETEVAVDLQQRHERHLARDDEQADDEDEQ